MITKAFRIKVRVQNNRLIRAREELGLTQAEATRRIGLSHSALCAFENLNYSKWSPYNELTGEWTDSARKVADYYGLSPEYLWPEEVALVKKSALQLEVGGREVVGFLTETRDTESEMLPRLLNQLNEREKAIIEKRFFGSGRI